MGQLNNQTNKGEARAAGLKSYKHDWDQFDRLPREIKELVWYAPIKTTIKGGMDFTRTSVPAVAKRIREDSVLVFRKLTDVTYGPGHPQGTPLRTLKDLGF